MASSEVRIVGGVVVTQNDQRRIIDDGEVAYDPLTGRITYVGEIRGLGGDIDAAGCVVLPGLTNGHTHSGMTPMRGYSDDGSLQGWLEAIREFEELMTYDDVRAGLRLALAEMIQTGTTSFADMFMWDATLLADVADAGMRVLASPAVFDYDAVGYPAANSGNGRDALDATERLATEFSSDPLVHIAFGPHAPYSCPPELLQDVARRAARLNLPVHIHLSETAREVDECRAAHGVTPIGLARRCGLFDNRVHVAHGVHATEQDCGILAAAGASVTHSPVSNLKLGAGIAPVAELLAAGVTVALGTDSVASNNSLDMFEEIKTGAIIHRGLHENPDVISAADVLDMATLHGASAIGCGASGRLVVGEAADIIVVSADTTRATPLTSPTSFLIYAANGQDVRDVVVAGRPLMRNRRLLTIDVAQARAQVAGTSARIRAQLAH
ncbi:MAG: amidohydrolase [Nakamurella sp.]